MGFVIETAEDELLLLAYQQHRNLVRNTVGHGVYPNLVKTVTVFAAFEADMAGPLADPELLAYHVSITTAITPYMEQIKALSGNLIAIIEAIEAAVPGTFGIQLPAVVPPQQEPVLP